MSYRVEDLIYIELEDGTDANVHTAVCVWKESNEERKILPLESSLEVD